MDNKFQLTEQKRGAGDTPERDKACSLGGTTTEDPPGTK